MKKELAESIVRLAGLFLVIQSSIKLVEVGFTLVRVASARAYIQLDKSEFLWNLVPIFIWLGAGVAILLLSGRLAGIIVAKNKV